MVRFENSDPSNSCFPETGMSQMASGPTPEAAEPLIPTNVRQGRMSGWKFVVTVCFSLLLQGIDYGIVMPSMLAYMTSLDPKAHPDTIQLYFGAAMSCFSLASLLFSDLSIWFDRRPMKEVILVLTSLAFVGSMLYGLAIRNWMVLGGRIICGIAYNIFTGSNLYVIRTTSISERSALFTKITMAFAIGTALGPAINFPLSKIDHYDLGPFEFSANSSPGYVMAALFLINGLTFLFLFEEPHFVPEPDEDKKNRSCTQEWKAIFSKFGCVVLISTQFLVIFTQSTVELLVTPQTKLWYDFTPFENSLLFTGMTVVVVIAIIAVGLMVRWFQDRTLLMMGHSLVGAGTLVFVIFLVITKNRVTFFIEIWQFCVVCCLYVAAIAFYQTVLGSLFSKLLDDPPLEGRGQSVMGSSSAAGAILGPIVSTILLPHGILYVPAVVGGLWGFVLFLLLISWHKMYVHEPVIAEFEEEEEVKGYIGINDSQEPMVDNLSLYTALNEKK